MFKKHRLDCEHPKNAQFDVYAINSNVFKQTLIKFCKNFDNYVTNPSTKIFSMKIKATQDD